ncbi:Nfx1-type zinc finger-containing protein [Fragilaria crotonensis]|nr:Nfx1-type zinc finger-containing protein [Fragilaria crotonensis]
MSIYITPELLPALVAFDAAASLAKSSADVLCCFLLEISVTFVEPRGSDSVKALALALRKRGGVGTVDRLCFVLYVDEGPKEVAYAAAQFRADPVAWGKDFNPPGGRHDNDFLNYRDIRLVPTLDEIQSEIPSYLPMASEANKVIDDPDLRLLDSNFRLLREDALQTMKLNISGQVRAWKHARIVDLHSKGNAFNAKAICPLAFKIRFSAETNKNIDWGKSSALSHGSVVALCHDGRPVRLGTISMRDERTKGAWLNAPGGPIIGNF